MYFHAKDSKNCKKELNYADAQNIDIVPVMAQKDWKATQWLGIITAGLLWMDFRYVNLDFRTHPFTPSTNITLQ